MKKFLSTASLVMASLSAGLPLAWALTPPSVNTPVATYGFNVKAAEAFTSILPSGWKLLVKQGTPLPETLSWEPGQRWQDIIARWGEKYKLSVSIDEVSRQVSVGEPLDKGVVAGPAEVPSSNAAQGKTPMPSLNPSFYAAAPESMAPKVESMGQGSAMALKSPELLPVVTAIANKFGYCLMDGYKKPYTLVGPVTLLGRSAEEDTSLLEQAIGLYAPVAVKAFPSEKVIRVYPTRTTWEYASDSPTSTTTVPLHCDN